MSTERNGISRRRALQILGGGGMLGLAGCLSNGNPFTEDGENSGGDRPTVEPKEPPTGPPDTTFEFTPEPAGEDSPAGVSEETWLYNDALPGPEIRATEGEVIGVSLENGLPAGTTIHWHGIPLANAMDGVPNVTQAPVEPGESFNYRFRAEPAGTYFYHSHVSLQLDRGLAGPLVIEESDRHVEYDREYVIVLDDYLSQAPRLPDGDGTDGMGDGGFMDGMMNVYRPPYAGMIMNGRPPSDAPTFDVAEGERGRFRFVNASSATMFQIRTAGHQFDISHADGRPVEPVSADTFAFGPGERYDAIITADNPGAWEILATPVRGSEPSARGVLQYEGEEGRTPTRPETGGRQLSYDDLRAIEHVEGLDGSPDRTFDLVLSRGGDGYSWAINGQIFPSGDRTSSRRFCEKNTSTARG